MFQDVTAAVIELVLQDIPFITVRLISILGMFCFYHRLPLENKKNLFKNIIYSIKGNWFGPHSNLLTKVFRYTA